MHKNKKRPSLNKSFCIPININPGLTDFILKEERKLITQNL